MVMSKTTTIKYPKMCYYINMDAESRARRQSLRVIVSEIIMVITVIVTVAILALLVSGYWLNSNFELERQGMLQINSIPTGASVEVDGDAPWFQRTNTSKVLSSGEHEIVLAKDGYDSWSKTVTIGEGLLYRVNYPRLFLLNREKSKFYDASITTFASVSPDRNSVLLANNTTSWVLLKLDSEEPKTTDVDIAKLTTFASVADGVKDGLFTGDIISANWDANCSHVLLEVSSTSGSKEWLLLDVKNPAKSLNLTREFAINFAEVRIFDASANNLLGLHDGTLRKIDVSGRQISAPIASEVKNYDFYESEIIYATDDAVYSTKINSTDEPILISETSLARPYITRFYENKYITIITADSIALYKKDDLAEVFNQELAFSPDKIKIGQGGGFIFMQSGTNVSVLDMEILSIINWELDTDVYGWLDGNMIYNINDGKLIVYDYDGLNRRELSSSVSAHFPVTITNDKWLYYLSDNSIIREIIAQ